jgi:hypothetical protein
MHLSPREWMSRLCGCSNRWQARREAVLSADLFYVDVCEFGRDLIDNVVSNKNPDETRRGFACIEVGLKSGDTLTQNLIVVGLFESMQGGVYRRLDPPDGLDEFLGPQSLVAWRDLIEGWTGEGIRSIEHWKRVLLNGPYSWIRWNSPSHSFRWPLESSVGAPQRVRNFLSQGASQWAHLFCPLVAQSLGAFERADSLGCGTGYSVDVGDSARFRTLRIGERDQACRVVCVDERLGFVAEPAASLLWPWDPN